MRTSTAALAAGIALAMSGMAQAAHQHRHIARVVIRTPGAERGCYVAGRL
jgi:hypothetical protein